MHTAVPTCIQLALEGNGETTLVLWLANTGRLADARVLGERLVSTRDDARPLGDAFSGMAYAYALLGLAEQARESGERAREEYRRLDHHYLAYIASSRLMIFVLLPFYADDLPARRRVRAEAERDWQRITGAMTAEVSRAPVPAPLGRD